MYFTYIFRPPFKKFLKDTAAAYSPGLYKNGQPVYDTVTGKQIHNYLIENKNMGKNYVTPWHGSNSIFVRDPADSGKSAIEIGEKNFAVECPYCRMKNASHKFLVRGTLFDEVQKGIIEDDKYYDGKTFWFSDNWQSIYQNEKNQAQNAITKFYAHANRYNHHELIPDGDIPVIVRRGGSIANSRLERKKSD